MVSAPQSVLADAFCDDFCEKEIVHRRSNILILNNLTLKIKSGTDFAN